jgi:hypothetical protein
MSKHTFQGRRERGATSDGATAGQALEPDLAFVVQLRGGPATSRRSLRGRVEHVVSGEVLRFVSTAELVEFLTRRSGP